MGEALLAKTKFQAFLFVGGVIAFLYSIFEGTKEQNLQTDIINKIFLLTLAALAVFVVALVIHAFHPEAGVLGDSPAVPRTEPPPSWPTPRDIRLARGFMLLGLLIYMGYHFLDGFVIDLPENVQAVLHVRIAVSAIIMFFWALSFTAWFRQNYVWVMTVATCIAGVGIAAMMYLAGPRVHFYYEGFIQVIAFAAFAFRLPARALAWECAFLLSLYAAVTAYQTWSPGQGFVMDAALKAAIINNLVSLVTFVALALATSIALARERS